MGFSSTQSGSKFENEKAAPSFARTGPMDSFVVRKRSRATLAAPFSPEDSARVVVRGWTRHVAAIAR